MPKGYGVKGSGVKAFGLNAFWCKNLLRVHPTVANPDTSFRSPPLQKVRNEDEGTMNNLRRCAPRARMAAGALVDAAVQWLGQVALAILFFLQFNTFCIVFLHIRRYGMFV